MTDNTDIKVKITPPEQDIFVESNLRIGETGKKIVQILDKSNLSTATMIYLLEDLKFKLLTYNSEA